MMYAQPITRPRIATIQRAVAAHYGLDAAVMKAPTRRRPAARARWMAMLLARELTERSLPVLGRAFGRRDHTTVLHGIRAMQGLIASEDAWAADASDLRHAITGRDA